MSEVPTGTVTFLFTDIEGSTRRWEQLPDAMRSALARHDALLGSGIESHGGYVFKTVGDAFYAAFATAVDALAAALSTQCALQGEAWGDAGPLRVRMAIHAGAAELRDGDYFGQPLNRVARLLSAGHGGQILLSDAAQELLGELLPPGVSLRDLGERRLKDIERPLHIFQAVAPDLPAEFPPLKTLDLHPNNLPAVATPLIGREKELELAQQLLLRPDVRLVTLSGPGGTGKTRLSLQIGAELIHHFEHGVFFVALEFIDNPRLVASTIAQALGLLETGAQPIADLLKQHLLLAQMLLVLDNFEQLLPASSLVVELMAACPKLKVLVTSQAVLRVRGEQELPIPPLSLPDSRRPPPLHELQHFAAVALFVQRAQATKPDFELTRENAPAVVHICHRLDGLPLAIELAAARIRLLAPQAMLPRLERRLALLTGGARDLPARQQTLRNAIGWSYDLLAPHEQQMFRRLAVFLGGCTLEGADAVCNAAGDLEADVLDEVESLVSKSLLRQEDQLNGDIRFKMLETIREYGLERLAESGEEEGLREQHGNYYLALAEQAEPKLTSAEQGAWLDRLEHEHDNLRAALHWWSRRGEAAPALRAGGSLWRFWQLRGHLTEGRERLVEMLGLPGAAERTAVRAAALNGLGSLARSQADLGHARALFQEALEIRRGLGDRQGASASLNNLGNVAHEQGEYRLARTLYEESLAIKRELGDRRGSAASLGMLGNVTRDLGDLADARSLYEQSLAVNRQLGDRQRVAVMQHNLGDLAFQQGDYAQAESLYQQCLATYREIGDRRGFAHAKRSLADAARERGELSDARALYEESLLLLQEIGDKAEIARLLEGSAAVEAADAQPERAMHLAGAAAALREALGAPPTPAEQATLDRWLEEAGRQLGMMQAAESWAEGQGLGLDEAICYVLEREPQAVSGG